MCGNDGSLIFADLLLPQDGSTPLTIAGWAAPLPVVKYLLDRGSEMETRNDVSATHRLCTSVS